MIKAQADALGLFPEAYATSVLAADLQDRLRSTKGVKVVELAEPDRDVKPEDLPGNIQRSRTPSGFAGVYAQGQRWRAMLNGRVLGVYVTPEAAALARYEEDRRIKQERSDAYDTLMAEINRPQPAVDPKTLIRPAPMTTKQREDLEAKERTAQAEPVLGLFAKSAPAPEPVEPEVKTAWEDAKERRRLVYRQELIENGMLDEHGVPFPDMIQYITEPY